MISWFLGLDVKLQVAFIGVGSALLTIIIKDIALHLWMESRTFRQSAMQVYRNYADPLASASESLFWRLRETLTDAGRGAYLRKSGTENYFDRYKFESTLFRLAVLIGWLRAYRRELTFLSIGEGNNLQSLKRAIHDFEAALADGAHVEEQRLRSISELWGIPVPDDKESISNFSVRIEQIIKSAGPTSRRDQDLVINLDETIQLSICQSIADYLCDQQRIDPISPAIISETRARAVRSLSIREAWLYRDFQSGIGDLMIKEISGGARRFEVIGFREFEAMMYSQDQEIKRWISRLHHIFDRLDISGADRFDARVQMLERTFLATIDLLAALSEVDQRRSVVSKDTLAEAMRLKQNDNWRKGAV